MCSRIAPAAALAAAFLLSSCSPKAGESVVLEVGSSKVTLREFENFYSRNSVSGDTLSRVPISERERFLDLLTRYKLKLQDAADRNLAADPEVQSELREYRSSLAATWIIEKEISEPGVRLLYDRKTEELRGSHILIAVKPEDTPPETLNAYRKAMELIAALAAGADFDSVAIAESQDPTVKVNRGDLYYFTGGQMVMPFENAAYAMKEGEISTAPVRTSFGYHILKVTDRQPVRGSIRVRHIMALARQSPTDTGDTAAALGKIRAWRDSLAAGADLVDLATRLSEDQGSAARGGDLGWMERKRYVQPFDEAAFLLRPGELSPIVKTPYGYHIIRCDSARPFPSYAEMRAQQGDPLKRQYQQIRFSDDFNGYVAGLMRDYSYSFDERTFRSLLSVLDSNSTTQDSAWDGRMTAEIRSAPLMTANGVVFDVDTVFGLLLKRPELQNTLLRRSDLEKQFRKVAETILLDMRADGLETRSAEFGELMRDYRDGIVLYRAEQLEVWSKVSVTDSALRAYWEANREEFKHPGTVTFAEMNFDSDTLALVVYDSLLRGAEFDALARVHNEDDSLKARAGVNDAMAADIDEVTEMAYGLEPGQFTEPFSTGDGSVMIIRLVSKTPPRPKSYEEAGAELSNAYQDQESKRLENIWIEKIKLRHPVVQHREHLRDAFTRMQ